MTDNRQPSGWRKRALLFLTSQCITLFGSTLVQMALVWYAAMETASGGWVAAFLCLLLSATVSGLLFRRCLGGPVQQKGTHHRSGCPDWPAPPWL